MKLENVRQAYYDYSGKTSEIVRQLGFAGIALIWIFKSGVEANPIIPTELIIPAIFIVLGLTLDLSHYIAGTITWGIYNRVLEKQGTSNKTDFLAPRQLNWATNSLFVLKVGCIVIAYIYILVFLKSRFFQQ